MNPTYSILYYDSNTKKLNNLFIKSDCVSNKVDSFTHYFKDLNLFILEISIKLFWFNLI